MRTRMPGGVAGVRPTRSPPFFFGRSLTRCSVSWRCAAELGPINPRVCLFCALAQDGQSRLSGPIPLKAAAKVQDPLESQYESSRVEPPDTPSEPILMLPG